MGEQRSHQLLVRLTWTLLLLSVGGQDGSASQGESGRWSDVTDYRDSSFYQSEKWDDAGNFGDYDDYGDDFGSDGESLVAEVGDATDFDALDDDEFQMDSMDVSQSPGRLNIACSEAGVSLMGSNLHRSSGLALPSMCPKPEGCTFPKKERVTCGRERIPPADCREKGCCVDFTTRACYYPMNECTMDKRSAVFVIRHDSAPVKVDPTKLGVPGRPECKPVIATRKFAVFKFSFAKCGAVSYDADGTKIGRIELQPRVKTLDLKYGVITREDAVRFRIECHYKEHPGTQFVSTVYTVKKYTDVPSKFTSTKLFGVTLRLAKDQTYSSYFPTNHRPLQLLLGQPVYLELTLTSKNLNSVILVNYCLAYPRSAKNALVLVYEGCANPNDPGVSILHVSSLPRNRYQRRFVVRAFQFMDQQTNKYLDEEIYFMCSTEVCHPREKTCRERCFDRKAP